jgi:hypothetical protein
MQTLTPWHRLFGITLTDLFAGRPWRVEVEKELALRSQRLDILLIERRAGAAAVVDPAALAELPDGLESLAAHNLLTYKSPHEPLDAWAVEELIGHYVTYRKLVSREATQVRLDPNAAAPPATAPRLPPEDDFRLYAVATRHPRQLLGQLPPDAPRPTAWPGVYDLAWGPRTIRLLVLDAIDPHPRNAPWELFSARMERVRHGFRHYHPRTVDAGEFLTQLSVHYRLEIPDMAYTIDDFHRDTRQLLRDPEALRLLFELIPPEERLRGLPPEERLRGLDPEEVLRRYAPEDRLRGLDPEQIKAWLERKGH